MSFQEEKLDSIIILDFGGQYCHLIARRVRELYVYSQIYPNDITVNEIKNMGSDFNIKGIILSGSPASVKGMGSPKFESEILEFDHELAIILEPMDKMNDSLDVSWMKNRYFREKRGVKMPTKKREWSQLMEGLNGN